MRTTVLITAALALRLLASPESARAENCASLAGQATRVGCVDLTTGAPIDLGASQQTLTISQATCSSVTIDVVLTHVDGAHHHSTQLTGTALPDGLMVTRPKYVEVLRRPAPYVLTMSMDWPAMADFWPFHSVCTYAFVPALDRGSPPGDHRRGH